MTAALKAAHAASAEEKERMMGGVGHLFKESLMAQALQEEIVNVHGPAGRIHDCPLL